MPPLQFISKLSSHIAMSHTGNPQTSLDTRLVNELQLLLVLFSITAIMHMHNSAVHTVDVDIPDISNHNLTKNYMNFR